MIRRLMMLLVVANLGEAAILFVYKESVHTAASWVLWVGSAVVLALRDTDTA